MAQSNWRKTLFVVSIFGITMAFLEAAVVVYLRYLFYPQGFSFPLKIIPSDVFIVEMTREAATVIMLISIGWLAGRRFNERFAYFIFAFGVWDIFYYIFLKLILRWPESLFESDILFLIPVPWLGPILAPIIVSIFLIGASTLVIKRESGGRMVVVPPVHWILLILSGMIVIISFLLNSEVMIHNVNAGTFNWYIFSSGMILGTVTFLNTIRR